MVLILSGLGHKQAASEMTFSSKQTQATLRFAKSALATIAQDWEGYFADLKDERDARNIKAIDAAWLDYRNIVAVKLDETIEIGGSLSLPVSVIRKCKVLIQDNDSWALILFPDAIGELEKMIETVGCSSDRLPVSVR